MSSNIVIPAGKIYFDPFDAAGAKTGERYLGCTPGGTINVETETVEIYCADSPLPTLLDEVPTKNKQTGTITCDDISDDNLALFFIADKATVTQSGGAVVGEAINGVLQDRHYQLGASASNPTGVRVVSAVSVTDDFPNPAFTVDVDYSVDLALGRIYIIAGGGIADGTNLLVDYTAAANGRVQLTTTKTPKKLYGSLRFIADNAVGANHDIYAPKVLLRPNGEMTFKRTADGTEQMQIPLAFSVVEPDDGTATCLFVDGRPV
jgi:hypothetical protein